MDIINKIICADVLDGLYQIPDGIVTLVITSPPYNLGISYASANDDQPYLDYVKWLGDVFKECYRVLRAGGRLIVNIDAMTNRQDDKDEEYFRDIRTDLANVLKPMRYKFYGEHVWYKSTKAGGGEFCGKKTAWGSYCLPSTPAIRRNHEYILVYSKDSGINGAAFTLQPTSESGKPDIRKVDFENWIASTWFINPETENQHHPVPFPRELVKRVIKLYSYPGDVILDPFNGSGTTTAVAENYGRKYIGIDIDEAYCEYARNRIHLAQNSFADPDEPDKKSRREIEAERKKDFEDGCIL